MSRSQTHSLQLGPKLYMMSALSTEPSKGSTLQTKDNTSLAGPRLNNRLPLNTRHWNYLCRSICVVCRTGRPVWGTGGAAGGAGGASGGTGGATAWAAGGNDGATAFALSLLMQVSKFLTAASIIGSSTYFFQRYGKIDMHILVGNGLDRSHYCFYPSIIWWKNENGYVLWDSQSWKISHTQIKNYKTKSLCKLPYDFQESQKVQGLKWCKQLHSYWRYASKTPHWLEMESLKAIWLWRLVITILSSIF